MALQNAFGNLALDASVTALNTKLGLNDPDGTLEVSDDGSTLFLDAFDGTLANWSTGGTAPTISGGRATFASNTTASTASYMRTNGTFAMRAQTNLRIGTFTQFETGVVTNNTRWWGYGQNQSSPTAAAPVLNGAIFMLDYSAGAMYAATYSAGTRTNAVAITRPTDGGLHKYEIWYRQATIYWIIDGATVATVTLPNLAVTNNMYIISGSINYTTAPSAAPVLYLSSASAVDMSGLNHTISDGVNPYLQATVKAASTAVASTDIPLAVGLHPSSPLPAGSSTIGAVNLNAGSNQLGWVGLGAVTPSSSFYTSTTTTTATVAKSSAGTIQALVISNTSTSAQWVKLYNATAVTLGTTAAVIDIPVAAGTTLSLPISVNGIRFPTGIAYAVAGATGATATTAPVANVLVALTYV